MKDENKTLSSEKQTAKRWRWYHGVLLFGVVNLAGGILSSVVKKSGGNDSISPIEALTSSDDNKNYYLSLRQPVFSPPSAVFPIVWAINNALVIRGILCVLNKPRDTPGRARYLTLQAASFADFVVFNAAFFGLRSPVNAALLTAVYLGLTLESGRVALAELKDEKVALSLATLLPWLLLAAPTSAAIALWNQDDFYNLEPAIEPSSEWEKSVNN
jgi:tryptophan-rich sensory protein